jgi:hypothetical protein
MLIDHLPLIKIVDIKPRLILLILPTSNLVRNFNLRINKECYSFKEKAASWLEIFFPHRGVVVCYNADEFLHSNTFLFSKKKIKKKLFFTF